MNKINELFKNVSDDDLLIAIQEIKEFDEIGILKNGIVRDYDQKVKDMIGGVRLGIDFITSILIKEAAFRWETEKRK